MRSERITNARLIGFITSITVVLSLALGCSAAVDDAVDPGGRYLVAGEIMTSETGSILCRLVNRAQYDAESTTPFEVIISPSGVVAGVAVFSFEHVPGGTYTVDCYQDTNGNGRLDSGAMGPTEPTGTYRYARPIMRRPSFDEVAFGLSSDRTDIVVELEI